MGLQSQSPVSMFSDMVDRQTLAFVALPTGLQQKHCSWVGFPGHLLGERQIVRVVHDHLQLVAALQQLCSGRSVRFGRECDPVERAAEWIDAACLQMGFGSMLRQQFGQPGEVVVQGFTSGDHREGRTIF